MFIELADILRCTRPHEDSWLVLRADLMSGRHVVNGELGCPVCSAAYPVVNGEANFVAADTGDDQPARGTIDPGSGGTLDHAPPAWIGHEDAPLRLAALLGLEDVRQPVMLAGSWGVHGAALARISPAIYLVVNHDAVEKPDRAELSFIRASGTLPLAAGKLHGAALDAESVRRGLLDGAARAVRTGGRLVAPANAALPVGYTELGRDDELWVAERRASPTGPPVSLTRASRGA